MKLEDLKNGELVQFSDERFGQGKGAVAGIFTSPDGTEYCIIYPKIPRAGYPFMCFATERKNLVLTPF